MPIEEPAVPPTAVSQGNLDRFSGFADLYDEHRPSPPPRLGPVLASYAGAAAVASAAVVDLGSGTGLSTRWAATWAASVIGVEPNGDMRSQAGAVPVANVTYLDGVSHDTRLPAESADVVIAVQAMHWMEPVSTCAEVARILKPRGVFAVINADWPPVTGVHEAEQAWVLAHERIRVLEARVARGERGEALRRPISRDDPSLADDDLHDPHRNRVIPGGVRSWSKTEHLARIRASRRFGFTRELLYDEPVAGGADRFVALMRSQGSYQGLRREGLTDDEIGVGTFEARVRRVLGEHSPVSFSWRVRLGVKQ
jgi:SAM-dependent methyltransferase